MTETTKARINKTDTINLRGIARNAVCSGTGRNMFYIMSQGID